MTHFPQYNANHRKTRQCKLLISINGEPFDELVVIMYHLPIQFVI